MIQGDFLHWVPLFNYFDMFFEKCLKPRTDVKMTFTKEETDFPKSVTLAVLETTERILENCNNKHLYQSYEVNIIHN